jgi:hypothetical protein
MKKKKFRWVLIDEEWTIACIESQFYSVIGNGEYFEIKNLKKDWGSKSKFGKLVIKPWPSSRGRIS